MRQTNDMTRCAGLARDSWKECERIHEEIWPTIVVPPFKRRRMATRLASDDQDDSVQFAVNTIPTSMVICTLIYYLKQRKSPKEARAYTVAQLAALLKHSAAILNNFTLSFQRLGDGADISCEIETRADVCATSFWTQDFWDNRVADVWAKAYADDKQTWIAVQNPMEDSVQLASVIGFAFSPNLPRRLAHQLRGPFLNLMGRYAGILNNVAKVLPEPPEAIPVFGHTMSRDACLEFFANTAMKLWSAADTCQDGTH